MHVGSLSRTDCLLQLYQGVTKYLCYRKEMLEPVWWHIPVVSVLGRQRQMDFCEFKASLIYVVRLKLA